ncbi:GNAT family N-acetyltransferase [Cryobacterium arcticum]|uniref:GNAT family acetyltransferase n=1 Tax=Cryobacterium arcticum TaxID=670052 RepID=A0A1B1BKS8_9MICO|nr:GNAT family N-acetyltransferase [Cryobacterium arcticum]ANP73141.1 GNAT family acetyltransferase [Cryobacterium arcticum]
MTLLDRGDTATTDDTFVYVGANDPLAQPVLTELAREYDERYGSFFGESASVEIHRYPAELFAAPSGAFVVLLRDGVPIAGGAFKRFDERTSELKRIWTSAEHRRQGLARRVVAELEDESRRRGYDRVFLTTGPRQPEAKELYLRTGYTPLFDPSKSPEEVIIHAFAKSLESSPLDVPGITAAHEAALAEHRAADPGFAIPTVSPIESD